MLISIVTPVLNGARTIERTLASLSVQKADFEHIVQDGGSNDGTGGIVASYSSEYPVSFHQEPDKGIYDAVANGMSKANGDILAWLGAGDYYLPWTLSTVSSIFEKYPEIDWITGIPAVGSDNGEVVKTVPLAPIYLQLAIKRGWYRDGCLGFLQQESMFWRRSLWEQVNAPQLIRRYRYGGDFHLWKAFAAHSELRTVSSVLAVFSCSIDQTSTRLRGAYLDEVDCGRDVSDATWWGRLFCRLVSIGLNGRLLRPKIGDFSQTVN